MGLTPHQFRFLRYLDDYIKKHGYSPSYDEALDFLNLASKSGVNRMVLALVERGYIAHIPNKARSITVLKMPNQPAPKSVIEYECPEIPFGGKLRIDFQDAPHLLKE